ncbi:MAG TPA: helix-turn-helix domain-containing protein [Actinomycetota bacterium]
MESWSPFSSHGLVLLALARRPELRLRELAHATGLTERAVQGLVADLVAGGYLERIREGRRNRYVVRGDRHLPDPLEDDLRVAPLLQALAPEPAVAPTDKDLAALVLGCSDHRYQEPLRNLLAAEGLLGSSEVILWPGGSAALGGRHATPILDGMAQARSGRSVSRIILVAHQGCSAIGRSARAQDPLVSGRTLIARRRRGTERVRRTFGVEPELWFLTQRGPRKAKSRRAFLGDEATPRGRTTRSGRSRTSTDRREG